MSKPYIAIRISAPNTKNGSLRSGWIVRELLDDSVTGDTAFRAFVWQHERGPEELFREFPRDTISILGGFRVTMKEYREQTVLLGVDV